jgi:hypothetical protein
MGLYYSGNAIDWWPAGVLDYHLVSMLLQHIQDYGRITRSGH